MRLGGVAQRTHSVVQDTAMKELLLINTRLVVTWRRGAGAACHRELFAYGGCGPAVSTSHLTPSIGEIALPHGKLMNVLRVQGHTLGYELTTGINNEISASQ